MPTDNYICPHCGAYDSTTCKMDITWRGVLKDMDKARSVGCRVAYYVDLLHPEKTSGGHLPTK